MGKESLLQHPIFLNEKEVSKIINRSVASLRRDRAEGRGLPWVRFGERSIRYPYNELLEYVKRNLVK